MAKKAVNKQRIVHFSWSKPNKSNWLHEETKSMLNSKNAYYNLVQDDLYFFLPKSIKIKIWRTVLPIVLYGCQTWSLTFRENTS